MNLLPFSVSSKVLAINATDVASASQPLPGHGNSVRIVNEGPDNCYFSIGEGEQIATLPPTLTPTSTCIPIPSGEDCTFTLPDTQTYNISAICRGTGTAVILVQVGEGW